MLTYINPILLLIAANVFWYGHLKYKAVALWIVVLVSWGIAFFEYCLQVPANRIGSAVYTTVQLKTSRRSSRWVSSSGSRCGTWASRSSGTISPVSR